VSNFRKRLFHYYKEKNLKGHRNLSGKNDNAIKTIACPIKPFVLTLVKREINLTEHMKTLKFLGIIVALLATSGTFAHTAKAKAAPGEWEKLGTKMVNMRVDHDVLLVTHHEGVYSKVRFGVLKAPIMLVNIRIIFGNNTEKEVVFNKRIDPGKFSRVVDLPGNKRIIRKIKMNYKTIPAVNGRAIFVAWGKH